LVVNNVAPFVNAGPDTVIDEGNVVIFSGSFTDPGTADTHSIEWDFGDGTTSDQLSPEHIYADDGQYTVTFTVTDDDGGIGTDTLTVMVANVAPAVDAGPDQTANEGDTVNLSGSFTDPGILDTHRYLWNFGDGSTSTELLAVHTYVNEGVYEVTLTVTDDDGGVGTDTLIVTVISTGGQAPEITQLLITENINENDIATLTGQFIDPDMLDSHTLVIDWGDGSSDTFILSVGDRSFLAEHQYLDDEPSGTEADDYLIQVLLTDDIDGQDTASATVTVNNLAPEIITFSTNSGGCGGDTNQREVSIFAEFTDAGTLDSHIATIDWGDGTITTGQITETGGVGAVSASHTYVDGGIYEIKLTVTDDDTGSDTKNATKAIGGVRVVDGVLQIIGTCGDDHITIQKICAGKKAQLKVHASFIPSHGHKCQCHCYKPGRGYKTFDAADITSIVVLALDGNDKVTIAGNVRITSLIDGGAGNDKLKGGSGADVILGAEGNDTIIGGGGRDLLIGGDGCDRIIGDSGDDILIGGTTSFDIDDSNLDQAQITLGQSFDGALRAILAEWNSQRSFCKRVKNLKNGSGSDDRLNGPFFLQRGITVFDDSDRDCMTGSRGKDWLISFDGDKLTDNKNKDNGNCQHQYQCSIWKLLTRLYWNKFDCCEKYR